MTLLSSAALAAVLLVPTTTTAVHAAVPEDCLRFVGASLDLTISTGDEVGESPATILNECGADVTAKVRVIPGRAPGDAGTAQRLTTAFTIDGDVVHVATWDADSSAAAPLLIPAASSVALVLRTSLRPSAEPPTPGVYTADFAIDWLARERPAEPFPPESFPDGILGVTGADPSVALALGAGVAAAGLMLLASRRRHRDRVE